MALSLNKRANFDYDIIEKYEAGLMLLGHEVKSARAGRTSLKGAFVTMKRGPNELPEFYLTNAHIPLYAQADPKTSYDPDRPRKLLLRANEIRRLLGKKREQGLTLVPIKLYTKRNLIKLEFGVGRGKKKYDKRETIKKREVERKIRTLTKHTSYKV